MPKSDWDYVNKSQDYELNDLLSKYGYRETSGNRELLRNNLSSNTKHGDVKNIIHKISGLEKK
ncbi:TPA: hypothetical protein NO539_005225 [Klebsiella pneumoniae]|uniref:hypothetical protein n=1 Tax=Klebsiella pneumoniae TaxID=573 RepID=UPI002244051A|nr:hypothetical protein [Klebsiella pneumoniae]MCW8293698.1 hypothetical protein [Klebsiella pneumoniae]HCI4292394.1 hypothetical protein [Klebsiella pneumoniae]